MVDDDWLALPALHFFPCAPHALLSLQVGVELYFAPSSNSCVPQGNGSGPSLPSRWCRSLLQGSGGVAIWRAGESSNHYGVSQSNARRTLTSSHITSLQSPTLTLLIFIRLAKERSCHTLEGIISALRRFVLHIAEGGSRMIITYSFEVEKVPIC
jgi:hypothetical protein